MLDREAKDFLVQETANQAALEDVALSDLEKRMMYFTETGEVPEDPIALNDEFEAKYDSDEYEAKISGLLHRAYARIKRENPEAEYHWKQAIRELRKGDHYLLVLRRQSFSGERPLHDFPKLIGAGILLAVFLVGLMIGLPAIFGGYGFHWRGQNPPLTQQPVPLWVQRSLVALMLGAYLYWGVLPLISNSLQIRLPRFSSRVPGDRKKGKFWK